MLVLVLDPREPHEEQHGEQHGQVAVLQKHQEPVPVDEQTVSPQLQGVACRNCTSLQEGRGNKERDTRRPKKLTSQAPPHLIHRNYRRLPVSNQQSK